MGHTDHFECKNVLRKHFKKQEIVEVDHHLCHAAGGYYASGYDDALIVSVDGFGDGSSGLMAHGRGTKLAEISRIDEENSIGLEYLRATVHLGLGGIGAEGKTQGLASYGEPTIYEQYMNEIEILPEGSLRLSDKLKSDSSRLAEEGGYLNTQLLNNKFLNDYCPKRFSHEPITDVHKNLAASIQKVLEHVVTELARIGKDKTGAENLVLSGGVSMNSSMNGRIAESGMFRKVFALPMSSDRGIAIGAALYHIHNNLGIPRFFQIKNVFMGNAYSDKDAMKAAKKSGYKYYTTDDPIETAARLVSEGKVVGWYQGPSEMGARALGHRSIVADPRQADMKDIINEKVKHREWFRPFAPSVMDDRANDYFDYDPSVADMSFMTYTVAANERAQKEIPAVVHVDNTSRIQTVIRDENPMYYDLIKKCGEMTGVNVVLNTSCNGNGEPIVESPQDAINTCGKTGMDVLVMHNIVVEK